VVNMNPAPFYTDVEKGRDKKGKGAG